MVAQNQLSEPQSQLSTQVSPNITRLDCMNYVLDFMTGSEVLQMQLLDRLMYESVVPRYFTFSRRVG